MSTYQWCERRSGVAAVFVLFISILVMLAPAMSDADSSARLPAETTPDPALYRDTWDICEYQKEYGPYDEYWMFSWQLCLAQDVLIAGSRGAAYMYRRGSDNMWGQEAALVFDSPEFNWISGATDGEVAVLGDREYPDGDDQGRAAVFRYHSSSQSWEEEQLLEPAQPPADGDEFGRSVSVQNGVAVVGASQAPWNGDPVGPGYACVFRYDTDSETWLEHQCISPSGGNPGDQFGTDVLVRDDIILVGARATLSHDVSTGSVYVFRYDPDLDEWREEQQLFPYDPEADGEFGNSLSLDGDRLLIGTQSQQAAYDFEYDSGLGTWTQQAKLTGDGGVALDFGADVALDGDMAFISNGGGDGSVFIFQFDGNSWNQVLELFPSDPGDLEHFGRAVTVSDGHLAVSKAGEAGEDLPASIYFFAYGYSDCNNNGIQDVCEVIDGLAPDCNLNLVPDICDIADGTSDDLNLNGIPDECEATAICETASLLPSDPAEDKRFGDGVAIDGDLALVGATGDSEFGYESGAAYVYRHDGWEWHEEAKLLISDGVEHDRIGLYMDIDGDVAVLGAPNHPLDGEYYYGAAYVFRYDADLGQWYEEAKLVSTDPQPYYRYGRDVAVQGDTVFVGCMAWPDTPGYVDVFQYDTGRGQWLRTNTLTPSDGQPRDRFGVAIDIQGDRMVIGASKDNDQFPGGSGAAYVFEFNGEEWQEEAKLSPDVDLTWSFFGLSVGLYDDVAVIGAPDPTFPYFENEAGSVWIYRRDQDTGDWALEETLVPDDGQLSDQFGQALTVSGDTIVAGAPSVASGYVEKVGRVYVYRYDEGMAQWLLDESYLGQSLQDHEYYGTAIDSHGDAALIGSPGYEDQGRAFVYGGLLALDCNDNGVHDACDISYGTSDDLNGNGIPDECESCVGDVDSDDVVNIEDITQILLAWGPCEECPEDIDGNNAVDIDDIFIVLAAWGPCP